MIVKSKTKKVYQQVIDYIGNLILEDNLKKGDKLPTERELSKKLGISRNSIREALKTLDVTGLVDRRQGDGTFIKKEFDNCLTEPLSIVFMLEKIQKREILEFRNMVEIKTVSLAAERITDAELNEIEEIYEHLKNEKDEEISSKYDKKFHYLIAKASKNLVILNCYNVMSSLLDAFISDIRFKVLEQEGKRERVIVLHKDILESLKNRDPIKAANSMERHMKVINSYYSKI